MNIKASSAGAANLGGGMLTFNPPDNQSLYKSYMPFLKNGGVYVPTTNTYPIGSKVFLVARLPNSEERLPIVGEVVWINQSKAVTRPAGIGIRFSDTPENAQVRDRIEKAILGISPETQTYTM